MGFMDLSTSVASKKHVDFNDARYQLADKLRQSGKKNVRSTFTLYDNKESNKIAVQDISAAYALSDKHLPLGELLNKMVDLIIDMEDGVLDTEKDAVYTWKYSSALLEMNDDKNKRQEKFSSFDNSLKNAVINSQTFIKRYPGKYTNRTNFFDQKVKTALADDIVATFKEVALPSIHESAIKQSRDAAEKHNNPILDRIVQWAVANYKCEVDSFFEIKEDESTRLFYSINTLILHLRNGYDMSIIGYVGTDHDDRFAISIFDANKIVLSKHGDRVSQNELKAALTEASDNAPVDPLTKLLQMEKKKNAILKEQHAILSDIRPMIAADVLELKAAESVVGKDYIWGCKQYRETHDDLPAGFKLEDIVLPQLDEEIESTLSSQQKDEFVENLEDMANAIDTHTAQTNDVEEKAKELIQDTTHIQAQPTIEQVDGDATIVEQSDPILNSATSSTQQEMSMDDILNSLPTEDLFASEEKKPVVEEKQFGDPTRVEFKMPTLTLNNNSGAQRLDSTNKEKEYDPTATLLPGFTPIKPPKQEYTGPSATRDAKPVETVAEENAMKWKETDGGTALPIVETRPSLEELESEPKDIRPEILLDDLDSLFE
jgi:hypothetical protein